MKITLADSFELPVVELLAVQFQFYWTKSLLQKTLKSGRSQAGPLHQIGQSKPSVGH